MVKNEFDISISENGVSLDSTTTSNTMIPLISANELEKRDGIENGVKDLGNILSEVSCANNVGGNLKMLPKTKFTACLIKTDEQTEVEDQLNGVKEINIVQNTRIIKTLKEKYCKLRTLHFNRKILHRSKQNNSLVIHKTKVVLPKNKITVNQKELTRNLQIQSGHNNLISCKFCKKVFKSLKECNSHGCKEKKNNHKNHKCMLCSMFFKYKNSFDQHIKGHYRNNCNMCTEKFANRKALCKHLKEVHSIVETQKLHRCDFCKKSFDKIQYLNAHLKVHADGKLVCFKCGLTCTDEEDYIKHGKTHAEETKYECSLCGKKFVRRQQHDQHMMGHERYSCPDCNATFSTKKTLQKHQQTSHGIDVRKKYECSLCNKSFERRFHLKLHKQKHTGERPYKCLQCETNFSCKKYLSLHMKTATHLQNVNNGKKVEIEKPFLCSICGAKFFRQQSLTRHVYIVHTPGEPYKCPHCDYSTKVKANFKRHTENHSNVKRYVCEICGSTFRALTTLNEHKSFVHSEKRSFTCDICNKGFKNKSSLQRHLRIHKDDRPFKCHCNRAYKRLSHLKRHMVAAHRMSVKKSFNCKSLEVCELEVPDSKTLKSTSPTIIETPDFNSSVQVTNSQVENMDCLEDLSKNMTDTPLLLTDSSKTNEYKFVLYHNVEDFLIKPDMKTISQKTPLQPIAQSVHSEDNAALSDINLNFSPSNFFNFNLSDSPLSNVIMENGSSEMQLQASFLTSGPQNVIRPRSLPNLNFQASSDDSLFPFLVHNNDLTPTPQFLLNSELPSPPVERTSTPKQLFAETGDILSLSTTYDKINELLTAPRTSELWDAVVNNSQASNNEVAIDFSSKITNNLHDFSGSGSSLLACNLMFPNDTLLDCSIGSDPFNSEYFAMP